MKSVRQISDQTVAVNGTSEDSAFFHTFPSLLRCHDGSLLCTCLVGREKSGPDGRIRVLRSEDDGQSWKSAPTPTVHDETENPFWGYLMCHIAEISPGRLLAVYLRSDRFNPEEALFHPKTSGMQHTTVRFSESVDNGRTWLPPWNLNYELPDLIVPSAFVRLSEQSLGMPFEVWHEWEKGWKEGPSTRLISSEDGGKTWAAHGIIAQDRSREHIYGDPRVTRVTEERLVALLWAHNISKDQDLPIHRSESFDNGRTWSAPESTGITGQIACPVAMGGGLMVMVYQKRFGPDAGLRSVQSLDSGVTWDGSSDALLWKQGGGTDDTNPFSGYQEYSFGYSSVKKVSDEEFLITFWAANGKVTDIRMLGMKVA